MNSQQLKMLIKNIQTMMRCPKCGGSYQEDQIHFLGQLDKACLVQLFCTNCKLPVAATVIVSRGTESKPAVFNDAQRRFLASANKGGAERVSTNDVIEMHEFLQDFDGNFEEELEK